MGTVNDNSFTSSIWSGTNEDDTLVYRGGGDAVDGLLGYDVLVIPYSSADSIIGIYANSSVTLQVPDRYLWTYGIRASITALNIEQIQFLDKVVTLQERQAATPATTTAGESGVASAASGARILEWGANGFWSKSKRLGASADSWLTKGSGRKKRYLIDYSVEVIENFDPSSGSLSLTSGGWDSVTRLEAWGGTLLYSGSNVIAYFSGINPATFDVIQKL